jgi:hypothetical protein
MTRNKTEQIAYRKRKKYEQDLDEEEAYEFARFRQIEEEKKNSGNLSLLFLIVRDVCRTKTIQTLENRIFT